MNEEIAAFATKLAEMSPKLSTVFEESSEYWAPEDPPYTILLADLGCAIVDEFLQFTEEERGEFFTAIESAMQSSEVELKTAVATGMIEAMIGRSERTNRWPQISSMFGPYTQAYIDAISK